jgi:hypothetical protein
VTGAQGITGATGPQGSTGATGASGISGQSLAAIFKLSSPTYTTVGVTGAQIKGITQGGTPPFPSECSVQFISASNYISPGSGVSIGSFTSTGVGVPVATNNEITLAPGNYMITYAISNTNQTDFAITTSLGTTLLAQSNIITGTHLNGQLNRSFSPLSAVVSVGSPTTIYLVNFYLNPVTLQTALPSLITPPSPYELAYLSIFKIN